jgi:spermidine/putrescine transport system substrate-binding protein
MRRLAQVASILLACGALAACGGDDAEGPSGDVAPAPADPEAEVSGELRVFAYEDTVTDELLDPFREANPDLDVRTATFNSNQQAAAKLAGGFEADVVEVCLDEMRPLQARGLLRPLDTGGVPDWDDLVFTEAEGVRDGENVYVVPLSAGPQGLIYNTEEVPDGVDSFADLFDAEFADRVALEGDYSLPPIAETALALGIEDPMNLTPEQLDEVQAYLEDNRDQFRALWRSDSDLVNLFKSGEVVLADGGPGIAQRMRDAGVPVEWVAPSEGALSWVCGLSITTDAANTDAAYALINWQASPEAQAIRAEGGYVVTNPEAMSVVPEKYQATADPATLQTAIAETEPPRFDQWTRAFEEFQAG